MTLYVLWKAKDLIKIKLIHIAFACIQTKNGNKTDDAINEFDYIFNCKIDLIIDLYFPITISLRSTDEANKHESLKIIFLN